MKKVRSLNVRRPSLSTVISLSVAPRGRSAPLGSITKVCVRSRYSVRSCMALLLMNCGTRRMPADKSGAACGEDARKLARGRSPQREDDRDDQHRSECAMVRDARPDAEGEGDAAGRTDALVLQEKTAW